VSARDPIGELVFLARSAAEAGVEWRGRLRREWLPRVAASEPRELLVAAIAEWDAETPAADADIVGLLEAAVRAAMAEQGYD
jgi:hypothetical protein